MKSLKILLAPLVLTVALSSAAWAAEQTTCPVMGAPITKELYADHDGKRVYFCCSFCDGEFKKAPQKYLDRLKEQGQEAAPVPKS
ncbi:MAG: hypothetical protein C0613_02080 [Desulfobulbaceae bacterium]|nr:MAG: hypothetical protein C0613_02080 [Desulfobulbaceae bacterium]